MGFLRNLFKRKTTEVVAPLADPTAEDDASASRRVRKKAANGITRDFVVDGEDKSGEVAIWDLDGTAPAPDPGPVTEETTPAPRPRRNKTRIIGFESDNSDVVSLFDSTMGEAASEPAIRPTEAPAIAPTPEKPTVASADMPLGWLVVSDGPGRGNVFTVKAGKSAVGGAGDFSVALDFGDISIAPEAYAEVNAHEDGFEICLGVSGKTVWLNDKPLVATQKLKTGATVRLGDTSLRFVALCDGTFTWSATDGQESGNVATA